MRVWEYLESKAVTLIFLGIGGIIFAGIMLAAQAGAGLVGISAAAYLSVILLWLLAGGLVEGRRVAALEKLLEELPEKYLLGEVLPRPADALERRYFQIMKEVSGSAVGIAQQALREKDEYCDYVEGWIHEIKTPLTACSLILSNGGDAHRLRRELKRADNLTESILYYARLRTAQKDMKIKEFRVAEACGEAVRSQMELLTAAGISVEVQGDFTVHSDRKSLCFILKQLLINCAKYCPGARVEIGLEDRTIRVRDNGPGIPSHELPRVMERGFTGSNRDRESGVVRAAGGTGMGLYLVRELCSYLDIGIKIESAEGEFTCISLSF